MLYPKSLEDAINSFKKLPGVGEKSAERYALSLLDLDEKEIEDFSKSVKEVKESIKTCRICGHLTDKDICNICSDKNRNDNLIKMQPGLNLMLQPFMMNMQPVMQMGQMNQLHGMENNGMNPFTFGLGMPANNELQRQINEGLYKNMEKTE